MGPYVNATQHPPGDGKEHRLGVLLMIDWETARTLVTELRNGGWQGNADLSHVVAQLERVLK